MQREPRPQVRYRFGRFVLSPSRRTLLRDGREVPLIARYFDLLVLFVARRGEAIHRRDILDLVWGDVVVSDGALSQAVRTLRRVLDDDSREPTYVRTVQRHGYRFVFTEVIEEPDEGPSVHEREENQAAPAGEPVAAPVASDVGGGDAIDRALARLLRPAGSPAEEEDRREAAEELHALGTDEALRRLDALPGHQAARAVLRDTRWDVAMAGAVPILGRPGALRASMAVFSMRLGRVWRLAGNRWLGAVAGASVAGLVAGLLGALALRLGPGSTATNAIFAALPAVGVWIGALGAAGVAAGLVTAEVLFRSRRAWALVAGGAAGGGFVGALAHLVGRSALSGLFGGDLDQAAGGLEGVMIGAGVGLGYAIATPTPEGGMAAPHGAKRLKAAAAAGLACAFATALLALSGRQLGATSLDLVARTFPDSQVGLLPLARLFGELAAGPVTRVAVSAWEGLMFGGGLVLGLTRRPRNG